MSKKDPTRTDTAVGLGCIMVLLLVISPVWLVIAAGVFAPFWIAGLIVLMIVAAIRSLFRK